jgi:molybdopterin/thiamine biosynthesis adenylyltransferase
MGARRWWQRADVTVEGQVEAFRAAELDFALDEGLLDAAGVVVFRGALRFGDRRVAAQVIYPPAFDLGEHPVVVAPGLEIGRHRSPDGLLCLDHVVGGESEPMSGPEAVERAERLWELWETDRAQLAEAEADVPDPWANYVLHTPETALALVDVDVSGHDAGYLHFALSSLQPMRGAALRVRATHPQPVEIEVPGEANEVLRGDFELTGPWVRLSEHPPAPRELLPWLRAEHAGVVDRAVSAAAGLRGQQPEMPALVGFVYPDEGPGRGDVHDAWLFLVVRPDGRMELPRPFAISSSERWVRQPQLAGLAAAKVAIVGVGALGSQVADLLGRAGVGEFVLVDNDIVTPGNRTRHELDLADIGRAKTHAVGDRVRRVNPWARVMTREWRLGTPFAGTAGLAGIQAADDELAALLGDCDIIVNATANGSASAYLSAIAAESGTPVVHSYVSAGAWGSRVLIQRPGESACWDCLAWWQADAAEGSGDAAVPAVAEEHRHEVVMERGCADPTFTGPGFELTAAAAAVARAATGIALGGDGYPAPDFDLATLRFRDRDTQRGAADYRRLPVHERCTTCRR